MGISFVNPLEDNTPLVEIVYEFNRLVHLKVSAISTTVSIRFFFYRGREKDRYGGI